MNYFSNQVEPLGLPGVARQLTAGDTSASTQLTSGITRISMRAVGADVRFLIQQATGTADASTSHFIANGERLDFAVPSGGYICYIRDASTDGVLEVTELV
jgi:hypothetical protein